MSTLSVTCPADGEQFVVVQPQEGEVSGGFSVTCPSCGEQFSVVYPNQAEVNESGVRNQDAATKPYEKYLANVLDWSAKEGDEIPDPYTGSPKDVPVEQYVVADIEGLGGPRGWDIDAGFDPEEIESLEPASLQIYEPDTFKIWYTPEHELDPEGIAYVVRASLETGVKTKNVYHRETPTGKNQLFIKNRGVPRTSDKQWTFLDKNECLARARQAGMSNHITQDRTKDSPNRYNIHLKSELQPLVDDSGELAEELVCELARMLVAFQTKRLD